MKRLAYPQVHFFLNKCWRSDRDVERRDDLQLLWLLHRLWESDSLQFQQLLTGEAHIDVEIMIEDCAQPLLTQQGEVVSIEIMTDKALYTSCR